MISFIKKKYLRIKRIILNKIFDKLFPVYGNYAHISRENMDIKKIGCQMIVDTFLINLNLPKEKVLDIAKDDIRRKIYDEVGRGIVFTEERHRDGILLSGILYIAEPSRKK